MERGLQDGPLEERGGMQDQYGKRGGGWTSSGKEIGGCTSLRTRIGVRISSGIGTNTGTVVQTCKIDRNFSMKSSFILFWILTNFKISNLRIAFIMFIIERLSAPLLVYPLYKRKNKCVEFLLISDRLQNVQHRD